MVFDSGSGVELVDAVAASSAVPGVWPPVTIGTSRYVDGGIDSLCNADLVVGHSRVLVLAPMADPPLEAQVSAIDAHGRALVVTPDRRSLEAFGADPLDPEVRAPSARAGQAQGRTLRLGGPRFLALLTGPGPGPNRRPGRRPGGSSGRDGARCSGT